MVLDVGVVRTILEAALAAVEEQELVFTQNQTAMSALIDIDAVGLSHGGQYGD